jgi:hypothetical protein
MTSAGRKWHLAHSTSGQCNSFHFQPIENADDWATIGRCIGIRENSSGPRIPPIVFLDDHSIDSEWYRVAWQTTSKSHETMKFLEAESLFKLSPSVLSVVRALMRSKTSYLGGVRFWEGQPGTVLHTFEWSIVNVCVNGLGLKLRQGRGLVIRANGTSTSRPTTYNVCRQM